MIADLRKSVSFIFIFVTDFDIFQCCTFIYIRLFLFQLIKKFDLAFFFFVKST